jgi:hypothetical protein
MAISKSQMQGLPARVIKQEIVESKVRSYQAKEIDLGKNISLQTLKQSLQESINSRRASTMFFLWSGERQNRKKEIDLQMQRMLLEEISNLGMTIEMMAQVEAKKFLYPEMVEGIISGHRANVELETRKFRAEFKKIDDEEATRHLQNSLLQAQVQALQTENFVKKITGEAHAVAIVAKANIDKATAEKEFAIARLVHSLVDQGIDVNNASITATFMVNAILGSKGNVDVDSILKEQMSDLLKQKQQHENDILNEKLRRERKESDLRENVVDSQIRENENIGGGTRSNI